MPKYKICFACTRPGEPGCGCPDNHFYAEYEFEGNYCDAETEAKKISWKTYSCDFRWWIEEDNSVNRHLENLLKMNQESPKNKKR